LEIFRRAAVAHGIAFELKAVKMILSEYYERDG